MEKSTTHIIREILPKQSVWSVRELKRRVRDQRAEATDRVIHNAITGLARRGVLEQVGYGLYRVKEAETRPRAYRDAYAEGYRAGQDAMREEVRMCVSIMRNITRSGTVQFALSCGQDAIKFLPVKEPKP